MSDTFRQIVRDEIFDIIKSCDLCIGKSLVSEFPFLGMGSPDDPVIAFTRHRDYRRTSLNEIDNAARFVLIFTLSGIDVGVTHNNSFRKIGTFDYENPDLFDGLFQLLNEKCDVKIVPNIGGTNDRASGAWGSKKTP